MVSSLPVSDPANGVLAEHVRLHTNPERVGERTNDATAQECRVSVASNAENALTARAGLAGTRPQTCHTRAFARAAAHSILAVKPALMGKGATLDPACSARLYVHQWHGGCENLA